MTPSPGEIARDAKIRRLEDRIRALEEALRELEMRAGVATDAPLPVDLLEAYRGVQKRGQSKPLFDALQAARTLLSPAKREHIGRDSIGERVPATSPVAKSGSTPPPASIPTNPEKKENE